MQRIRLCSQLRFQLLGSFVVVLLGNMLYANYAMHRTLTERLPNVEMRALTGRAQRLRNDLEQAYAQHQQLSVQLLENAPQVSLRLYAADGTVLESNSSFTAEPQMVVQALTERTAPVTVVAVGDQRHAYYVLPLHHAGTVIGALEVADELPPLDQLQASIQQELVITAGVSLCSILAFGIYLGMRFNQALRSIKRQTEAIVRGEFEQRLTVRSNDEIGQISRYLNQMAEDLQQLAQTRNEFLSKVSHELRTPLTIAKGFSSMLRTGPLLPQQDRTVSIIDTQIDDLTRLVNDLLDLSRRQHCTLALQTTEIDCAALLTEVVEHQREVLRGQKITLTTRYCAEDVRVQGDRQRLNQILSNLIGNASRYSQRYIQLEIDADDEQVIMRVGDDGPGIAPEDLCRIFEPFFQSRHGGRRGQAGLGLTVARELALAIFGTLEVESTPGAGATFVVRLPRYHARPAEMRRKWRTLRPTLCSTRAPSQPQGKQQALEAFLVERSR